MKATTETVARIEGIRIMREQSGLTFDAIGNAFGITRQLAERIYAADSYAIRNRNMPFKLRSGHVTPGMVWTAIQQLRRLSR